VTALSPDPTFYPTPAEAMRAPPEKVAYVAALHVGTGIDKPDFIAVVDFDPRSDDYGRIIHRVELDETGDELHHFGWNACSSMLCPYGDPTVERRYLIVPGLRSSNVYVLDTKPDPRRPRIGRRSRALRSPGSQDIRGCTQFTAVRMRSTSAPSADKETRVLEGCSSSTTEPSSP